MYSQREVQDALLEYNFKFGEGFPSFYFISTNNIDGMMDIITNAIKTGKPYDGPDVPDVDENGESILY